MLDAAFIREHLDAVKTNCRNRNVKADVDRVVQLDDERKRLIQQTQVIQQRQNEVSKLIPKEKDAARKQELIAEGKRLREEATGQEKQLKETQEQLHAALLTIPNMTHPDAPVGTTAEDNKVIRNWGEPRKFDFAAKDHVALAETLQLVDFEAGAAVAGQKFYYLKNEAVLLELALVQYAMQTLIGEGYTPIITPDVARVEVLEGIGFIPAIPIRKNDKSTRSTDTDLCLIATAEITLGGMHRDQIFDELDLPRKYVGLSHCFRTEAGASRPRYARLYRVHQFTKVEMFVFCTPDQSEAASIRNCWPSRKRSSRGWACRITSSTPAPAIWEVRLIASTTWKRGCRAAARRRVWRSDQHVQLHRLPGAPAQHPLQDPQAEGHALRAYAQRHRRGRHAAPCSPSSKIISRPTVQSSCRKCCGRGWARIASARYHKVPSSEF